MSTSHNKGTQILTTRTILGPWVLGVLAPYQPSQTSASTPIFARELWNALWTWQTRRPSWWVFGSMNAAQLHEASLQCNDIPTVPTILRRVKWGQAQHDGIPKLVPTTYEHQTTLVIPSVDVEWCRYITILSLLIPPKSTHYPRIGWKKCRETHCFMDKTSILDQPSGPCQVEPESAQGQRVFADKLCRDVDKNLVESPGGKQGGMGWMVLVSPNRSKIPTLNGKTARIDDNW